MKKIVLVAGLVVLMLFVVACAPGETLAGQAVKQDKTCLIGEQRCNFVNKASLQFSCEMVANENWPGVNGDTYCKQQEYQFCSHGFFTVQNKVGPNVYTPFSCGQVLDEEDWNAENGDLTSKKFSSYPNFEIEDVITVYSCCNLK
ncbi:hypothetical protein HYT55_02855 [Candidatus Woesearchaeota archaeon]|nr:hypothetical protein [Candidatus Woesearchaeota archaeon]